MFTVSEKAGTIIKGILEKEQENRTIRITSQIG